MPTVETPAIQKTPNVCGGEAYIRQTRIAVWMLVIDRKLGMTDAEVLDSLPALNQADLDAAWDYYRANPVEIEQAIWFNDTAANLPDGVRPPADCAGCRTTRSARRFSRLSARPTSTLPGPSTSARLTWTKAGEFTTVPTARKRVRIKAGKGRPAELAILGD